MSSRRPVRMFSRGTAGDRKLYGGIQHLLIERHGPEMPKLARLVGKTRIEFRRINLSDRFHLAAPVLLCIYTRHTGNL